MVLISKTNATFTNASAGPENTLTSEKLMEQMGEMMKGMRDRMENDILFNRQTRMPLIPKLKDPEFVHEEDRPYKYNRRPSWIGWDMAIKPDRQAYSAVSIAAAMGDMLEPYLPRHRQDPFGGIRVSTSLALEESYEDWSCVRSPGRARRRLKRGFRQNILHLKRPMKKVFQIYGTLLMHPEIKRQIEQECARTGAIYSVPIPGI